MPCKNFTSRVRLGALALVTCFAAIPAWAAGNLLSLNIETSARGLLPDHYRNGSVFVEAAENERFQLVLRNPTGTRKLAVVTVDGVNVISGKTGSTEGAGYILEPYETTRIEGWRKNMSQVAEFYFTYPEDAYATRTDRPSHLGVIGVAVFEEARPIAYESPPAIARDGRLGLNEKAVPQSAESSASALSDRAAAAAPSLGTGHGARQQSHARYGTFVRASSYPNEVIRVRYESRQRLIEMGILQEFPRNRIEPNPFPADRHFVPDPKIW